MQKIVLGLTGTIAAGKSTVSNFLASLNFNIINVDKIGHKVLQNPTIMYMLTQEFGEDVVENKVVNRQVLAHRAFTSAESVKCLNKITHPILKQEVIKKAKKYDKVVIDAALLFELNLNTICNLCWFVDAPKCQRITRLGVNKQDFLKREKYQEPYHAKRKNCHSILMNDGSIDKLHQDILALLEEIK